MEVCELDPDLVEVAKRWFGFQSNASRMCVHLEDGVGLVKRKAAVLGDEGMFDIYTPICTPTHPLYTPPAKR